jgi:hypothetical protein
MSDGRAGTWTGGRQAAGSPRELLTEGGRVFEGAAAARTQAGRRRLAGNRSGRWRGGAVGCGALGAGDGLAGCVFAAPRSPLPASQHVRPPGPRAGGPILPPHRTPRANSCLGQTRQHASDRPRPAHLHICRTLHQPPRRAGAPSASVRACPAQRPAHPPLRSVSALRGGPPPPRPLAALSPPAARPGPAGAACSPDEAIAASRHIRPRGRSVAPSVGVRPRPTPSPSATGPRGGVATPIAPVRRRPGAPCCRPPSRAL